MTPRGKAISRSLAASEILFGTKIGRPRTKPWEAIRKLHDEGLSDYRIGLRLKVGAGCVRYVVKKYQEEKAQAVTEEIIRDDTLPAGSNYFSVEQL